MVVVGFIRFYPFEVVAFKSLTIIPESMETKQGERVYYNLSFDKKMNIPPAYIRYYLVNGTSHQLTEDPPLPLQRPVGNQNHINSRYIPKDIIPGLYRLHIEIGYPITNLRLITYVWESDWFKVVE